MASPTRADWFAMRASIDAAAVFGVSPIVVLRGRTRVRPVALARKFAYWLARETSDLPWTELGQAFGRDHSTLVVGTREIYQALDEGDLGVIEAVQLVLDANRHRVVEVPDRVDHFAAVRWPQHIAEGG